MTDDLSPVLHRLPEPAPPSTITATVMARIAREEERHSATVPVLRRDRPAWVWALIGAGVVIGLRLYPWITSGIAPDTTTSRIGLGHLPAMPSVGPATAVMVVALLVYLSGLFAPLRRRGAATRR